MLTIFEAAKKGDIEALTHWVEVEKLDINQRDRSGRTPWLLAVQYADVVTLRWLVAHRADVSAKNDYFTDLYYVIFDHHGKAAERPAKLAYLQELGIEFAHPSFALICSDEWRKLKTISKENANYLKQMDPWGRTLIHYAAAWGNQAAVEWLLLEGGASIAEKDYRGLTALLFAASNGHLDVVQWLLREGDASIGEKNKQGLTALLLAASKGHLAVVQWLLQAGGASIGEKDEDGLTALLLAANNDHLNVVQWLLGEGGASIGDKDEDGLTALLLAASKGHLYTVQWLLQARGASIAEKDNEDWTALLWAVENGDLALAQWLLEVAGASITEKDSKSWTALLLAAANGNLEIVRWLIQKGGACITEKTNEDETALRLAFQYSRYDVALFLLDHQANISELDVSKKLFIPPGSDSTSKKLQATLQFAEALLKQEFATALACIKEAAAISVDFTLGEGNTPLHILARETAKNTCRNELISLLIKKGAHRYLLNAKAQTPIDIAKAQGDSELQGLLQTEFGKFYADNIAASHALMAKVLNGYLPEHGIPVVDMASRNYFLAAQFWPLILVEELHTLLGYCQMDIAICPPVQQKILEKLLVDFDEKVAAEEGSQVADYFLTEVEETELVKLIKSLQALNNLILKASLQSEHALKTMSDEIWIRDSLITSYQLQPLSVLKDSREEDKATKIGELNQVIAPPSSKRQKLTDNAESDSNKFLVDKWQSSFLAAATGVSLDLQEKEPASEAKISNEDVNRDEDYLSFGCHLL